MVEASVILKMLCLNAEPMPVARRLLLTEKVIQDSDGWLSRGKISVDIFLSGPSGCCLLTFSGLFWRATMRLGLKVCI